MSYSYHMVKNGDRGILTINKEDSFKNREISIMVLFAHDTIEFINAVEVNNKTDFYYEDLSKFEKMHKGLFSDMQKKYKNGEINNE